MRVMQEQSLGTKLFIRDASCTGLDWVACGDVHQGDYIRVMQEQSLGTMLFIRDALRNIKT